MNEIHSLLQPDLQSNALWLRLGKPDLTRTLAYAAGVVLAVDVVLVSLGMLVAAASG